MADDTKSQILEAALSLFAEKGFAGVGVREITQRAKVNVAAISYHFGSKEELYLDMVRQHVEPLNRERLRLLDEAMERGPTVRAVFAALLDPVAAMLCDEAGRPVPVRVQMAARVFADMAGAVVDVQEELFAEVKVRFGEALAAVCPEISAEVRPRRFYMVIALMGGAFVQLAEMVSRDVESLGAAEFRASFDDLIDFAAAGFSVPPSTQS